MRPTLLLTSFDTWQPHQQSNASDDLLAAVLATNPAPDQLHFLRKLPVDFQLAPAQLLQHFQALQPDIVVCCGMAEARSQLTVESNGKHGNDIRHTSLNLDRLIAALPITQISHDAGDYVCNWLYYSVLKYIQEQQAKSDCLFVHVPVLHESNFQPILQDFLILVQRLLKV